MAEQNIPEQLRLLAEDVTGCVLALACIVYRVFYVPGLILHQLFHLILGGAIWIVTRSTAFFNHIEAKISGYERSKDVLKGNTFLQSYASGPFRWIKQNEMEKIDFMIEYGVRVKSDIFETPNLYMASDESFLIDIDGDNKVWKEIKTQMKAEAGINPTELDEVVIMDICQKVLDCLKSEFSLFIYFLCDFKVLRFMPILIHTIWCRFVSTLKFSGEISEDLAERPRYCLPCYTAHRNPTKRKIYQIARGKKAMTSQW
jgi:hypothetical protein